MLFPLKFLTFLDPQHLVPRAHHEVMTSKILFLCFPIVRVILIMAGEAGLSRTK